MTDAHTNVTILAIVSCRITKNLPSEPSNARTSHIDCRAPLPAAGPLSALVLVPAQPSRRTEIQPAQRIQAKPDLNWRIVRARSHRRLRVPTRSIFGPFPIVSGCRHRFVPTSRGRVAAIKQNTCGKNVEALISIKYCSVGKRTPPHGSWGGVKFRR